MNDTMYIQGNRYLEAWTYSDGQRVTMRIPGGYDLVQATRHFTRKGYAVIRVKG